MALNLLHQVCPGQGWESNSMENAMNEMYLKFLVKAQNLMNNEDGQDLVEYALLVALLSVGAVASTRLVATAITAQFTAIAADIQ